MIIDDIKAIIIELEQEDIPPINVELVEHDLALVYENSNRAMVSIYFIFIFSSLPYFFGRGVNLNALLAQRRIKKRTRNSIV